MRWNQLAAAARGVVVGDTSICRSGPRRWVSLDLEHVGDLDTERARRGGCGVMRYRLSRPAEPPVG